MAKKKLTPKQRRMRAPIVPGSPVSFRDVLRDAFAEQRLRYGPVTQHLRQHQSNTGAWFDQYKADLAAKGQAQKQLYDQAVGGVQTQGVQAQQASNQATQAQDAAMRADAAQRGATYSGTPGAQAVAGADVRKALTDAFANAIQGQGLSYGAHTADQSTVGSAAQLSERLAGQKALEALKREKGAFRSQYVAGRRADEAKGVLERAAFDLDVAEFQEKAKPKPLTPSEKKVQRQNKFFDEHGYFPSTGAPKPKGGMSPADKRLERKRVADIRKESGKAVSRIHDVIDRWHTYGDMMVEDQSKPKNKDGSYPRRKPSPAEIRARLLGEGFKSDELALAIKVNAGKPLTKKEIDAAHRLGIRIPRAWIQKKPFTLHGPGSDAAQGSSTASASRRSRPRNVSRYNTGDRFTGGGTRT